MITFRLITLFGVFFILNTPSPPSLSWAKVGLLLGWGIYVYTAPTTGAVVILPSTRVRATGSNQARGPLSNWNMLFSLWASQMEADM
jgi:hypothetical protein